MIVVNLADVLNAPRHRRRVFADPGTKIDHASRATCTRDEHGRHPSFPDLRVKGFVVICPRCFPATYARVQAKHRAA